MGTLMCRGRWWDAPGVDGLGKLLPALPAHSLHVSHWGEPCWEKGLSSLLAVGLSLGAPGGHQLLGGGTAPKGSITLAIPQGGPAWHWKAALTPFKQHLAAVVSQQQPQCLFFMGHTVIYAAIVHPVRPSLMISRNCEVSLWYPSEATHFYEQSNCLSFPGVEACILLQDAACKWAGSYHKPLNGRKASAPGCVSVPGSREECAPQAGLGV